MALMIKTRRILHPVASTLKIAVMHLRRLCPAGRAWDYVEDVFVHVMTTRPLGGGGGGSEETGGGGGSMQHGGRGVDKDDPQQAKLAGLASEYNALLASQLDEQLRSASKSRCLCVGVRQSDGWVWMTMTGTTSSS